MQLLYNVHVKDIYGTARLLWRRYAETKLSKCTQVLLIVKSFRLMTTKTPGFDIAELLEKGMHYKEC